MAFVVPIRYYENFDARWRLFAPPATRKLRLESDRARWHFCDWFLGEGIRLSYLGAGRLRGGGLSDSKVEQIQVDDRKYGRLFEAYFERRSGLLLAIHETLTGVEALWFQQKHNRRAPT